MGATGGEGEKVGTMERVGRREGTGGVLDGALVEVNIKPPFPPPPPPPPPITLQRIEEICPG